MPAEGSLAASPSIAPRRTAGRMEWYAQRRPIEHYRRLFMRYVEFDTNGGCWLWTGGLNHKGYGRFHGPGAGSFAHRFAYYAFVGPLDDRLVCHRCDVPACVNPKHLFLGSPKDNVADMWAKGRASNLAGERHPSARLSKADVMEILRRLRAGETQRAVATHFGVSRGHVSNIARATRRYREGDGK